MDERQAVGLREIDTRHVFLMIKAKTSERDARGTSTYAVIADAEKVFQLTTAEGTTLALWDGGFAAGCWNGRLHASRTREWRWVSWRRS